MSNPAETQAFSAFDLKPKVAYRVIATFTDFDHITHHVGEQWIYQGKSFLPYEDGLSLFVERPGGSVSQIRLQSREGAHREIVNQFSDYVAEAPAPPLIPPLRAGYFSP